MRLPCLEHAYFGIFWDKATGEWFVEQLAFPEISKPWSWPLCFPNNGGYAKNHPNLDHVSIETHDFGVPPF